MPDTRSVPAAESITEDALAALATHVCRQAESLMTAQRRPFVLGIAGIGGAGKSTLAQQVLAAIIERLSAYDPDAAPHHLPGAALVPMDGFHFTNRRLVELGRRERKGAPDTFDVNAYLALLRKVREPVASDRAIPFPVYDRTLHEPALAPGGDHVILTSHRVIVTEGNYLLLNEPPWDALAGLLDECWLLDTPIEQARQWMLARHVRGGRTQDDAQRHYERSDLPNAMLMHARMRRPDRVLRWEHTDR